MKMKKTASDSSGNIDDSMTEDESTQSRRGATTKEQLDHSQTSEPVNVEEKNIVTRHHCNQQINQYLQYQQLPTRLLNQLLKPHQN